MKWEVYNIKYNNMSSELLQFKKKEKTENLKRTIKWKGNNNISNSNDDDNNNNSQ